MTRQAKRAIVLTDDGYAQAFIPDRLYREILKRQAGGKGMTWDEACVKTAKDADYGSEEFQKEAKGEARRLHNTEFMKQLNKARVSIRKTADEYAKINYARIRFPCATCGQNMSWDLSDTNELEQIMDILKKGGIARWHHHTCGPPPSSE